jgi:IclR family acetate operon transcriptional repressor
MEFTATTLRGPGELRQELAAIRARGHAYDLGEHEEDVRCVAAPILNRDGFSLGGISISAPSYRIGEAFQMVWLGPVKQAAATIVHLSSLADRGKLPLR